MRFRICSMPFIKISFVIKVCATWCICFGWIDLPQKFACTGTCVCVCVWMPQSCHHLSFAIYLKPKPIVIRNVAQQRTYTYKQIYLSDRNQSVGCGLNLPIARSYQINIHWQKTNQNRNIMRERAVTHIHHTYIHTCTHHMHSEWGQKEPGFVVKIKAVLVHSLYWIVW